MECVPSRDLWGAPRGVSNKPQGGVSNKPHMGADVCVVQHSVEHLSPVSQLPCTPNKDSNQNRALAFNGLPGGGCETSHTSSIFVSFFSFFVLQVIRHQSWSCFAQAVESTNPHSNISFEGPPGSSEGGGVRQATGGRRTSHTPTNKNSNISN